MPFCVGLIAAFMGMLGEKLKTIVSSRVAFLEGGTVGGVSFRACMYGEIVMSRLWLLTCVVEAETEAPQGREHIEGKE